MTLKMPPSGPHALEDILAQIAAYKATGSPWTNTALRKNDKALFCLVERLAKANRMRSSSRVLRKLGHPYTPLPPVDADALALDVLTLREFYADEGLPWGFKAIERNDHDVYNRMMRLGKWQYPARYGKRRIGFVAQLFGAPFGQKHTREQMKQWIAEYKQQGAAWNIRALKVGSGVGRSIYNGFDYFARKQAPGEGRSACIRRIAAAFGHPFVQKAVEPEALAQSIAAYKSGGNVWKVSYVTKNVAGRDLYNDLCFLARKRSQKKTLKTAVREIALELGHPFLAKNDHPAQAPLPPTDNVGWFDLVPEKQYAWLEGAFDKLWVVAQLETIHARDAETGQRAYVQPFDVKKKHRGLVAVAVRRFGSYKKAMESWDPGSYLASLRRYTRAEMGDDALETIARAALQPLFARDGYVSRERLRIVYPNAHHPVAELRKRKFADARQASGADAEFGYGDVLALLGCSPTELTPEQKKQVGWCGEAFSLAYFALAERAGAEEITEMHPRNLDAGKLEMQVAEREEPVLPDFARGNGQEIRMTEIKAGDAFPYNTAERVLEKYTGEFSVKDGDGTPVRFAEVHLHLPKKHIEQGVISVDNGAQYLLDRKDVKVLTAEDIAQGFVDYRAPDELHNLYTAFALRPIKFIFSQENRARLASLVDAVLPERWKPSGSTESAE